MYTSLALDSHTSMAYIRFMVKQRITVVETPQFAARAKSRMTADEVDNTIDLISADPLCGDLIQGTGGVRKVRFAVKSKGKRGGVRIVYYYYNEILPTFLLTVFAKREKDTLAMAERNSLAKLVRWLRDNYGE
jgi:hypothetical protein